MIKIRYDDCRGLLQVRGHAEYAPKGTDIVCSAVSVLLQTTIASAQESLDYVVLPGKVNIAINNHSYRTEVLMDALVLGLEMMANTYPDNVRFIRTKH